MNIIAKVSCYLLKLLSWAQCRYIEIVQKYLNTVTQYINLTLDKKLNSLIYRTLFYVSIYGSYKL